MAITKHIALKNKTNFIPKQEKKLSQEHWFTIIIAGNL